MRRAQYLWLGLVAGFLPVIVLSAAAVLAATTGCMGDDTLDPDDSQARPNLICKAGGIPLPWLSDTAAFGAVFAVLLAGPVAWALVSATRATVHRDGSGLGWALLFGIVWSGFSLLVALQAHLGFAGYG
jgi:hypothetical protein